MRVWTPSLRLPLAALLALAAGLAPMAQAQAPLAKAGGAKHIAILDYDTGMILACEDCDVAMPPASMSKLMTMLLVSEALKAGKITMQTRFKVSEKAWRNGAQSDGSHMFLELNSEVSVEDLIKGVIIVSANDACIVLAEGIAGSEEAFVAQMNARAGALGLTSARFRNTTGLPEEGHVISARDLAKLGAIIIREHSDLYRLYAERSFTYNGKTQENRNPLLRAFAGADGVKTGHTNVSGYGMIGSAVANGQRRIIVFNGTRSMAERASEAQRLMRTALLDYAVVTVLKPGEVIGQADVWMGAKATVGLTSERLIAVAVSNSVRAQLKAHIIYIGPAAAPIALGAPVAKLVVEGPGLREEFPLIAAEAVDRANPFARAGFGLGRLFGGGS
jgi:serine-type D-Ala-D-Ala carboxypeptidase (penicillin-binding protein 5/6)